MSTTASITLDDLLATEPAAALEKVAAPTRELLRAAGNRLVLTGAGPLGLAAAQLARKAGLTPVAFADNNKQKQGTEISGLPVMSPDGAVEKYGRSVVYLVAVYTSEGVWAQLRKLGVEPISFARLCWTFPEAMMPYLSIESPAVIAAAAGRIREGFGIWADDFSREEYLAQIRWRTSLSPEALGGFSPAVETLFAPDLIALREDESFVDCGAFDGDTLRQYLKLCGGKFGSYTAFEPDALNFAKLKAQVEEMPAGMRERVHLFPNALGSAPGRIQFDTTGTVCSTVGKGDVWVELVTLDDTAADQKPTFLKMDIEGAELEAIRGASNLIRKYQPIMAICLYHYSRDLWEIPLLIKDLVPTYNLYLRRYSNDTWEQICYAIPTHRSITS
jgi:FkbM family methyltransferase